MNPASEFASCQLEVGPVSPTVGHGTSAFGVSTLLHATIALLGLSIGVSQTVDLQVQSGESASQQVITLAGTFSPPESEVFFIETLGIETAEPLDSITPIKPVDLPVLPELELPSVPASASKGQPEAVQKAAPEQSVTATASHPPSDASTAASTAASNDTPGTHVDRSASPLPTNNPPEYPPAAVAQRREGRAVLRVLVDPLGAAAEVSLLKSSGHDDLDQAAIAAVRKWMFAPAMQGNTPVAQAIGVPIRFVKHR